MTVKLQIPLDKELRDASAKRAHQFGFGSTQALVRYMLKAIVDGRQVTFGEDSWGEPSDEAAARLNKWAKEAHRDHKAGKLKPYTSVEAFMKDLRV